MKLHNKLRLGFQENQSSLHVMLRNYQFMYAASTLLKTWVDGWLWMDGCAGRMQAIIRTNCEIVHLVGQGSCVFLRKKSGNFRNLSLWQPRVKDYIRNVKRVNGWTKLDIIEMFRHLFIFSLSACKVWLAPCHVSSRVPLVPSVQIF